MKWFTQVIDGKESTLTDEDYRKSLKVKDGAYIQKETWKERNVKFHRKYFGLLKCTINHLPEDEDYDRFRSTDSLRTEIMYQTGRFKIHRTLGGKEAFIPDSISFKSMDNEKFEELYSEAINIILKRFVPHVSKEDFENDILNFI